MRTKTLMRDLLRRNSDALLAVEVQQGSVLKIRVELNLVDGRRDFGRLQHHLEVLLPVVAHADAARPATLLDGLHLRPLDLQLLGLAIGKEGLMDQVQVDVVQAQLLERGREGDLDGLAGGRDVRALGHDVELLTRHTSLANGLAELGLVGVAVGAVEMGVAGFDGRDGVGDDFGVDGVLVGAALEVGSAQTVGDLGDFGAFV